jgi:hypothetical protein
MAINTLVLHFTGYDIRAYMLNDTKELLFYDSVPVEFSLGAYPVFENNEEKILNNFTDSLNTLVKVKNLTFERCTVLLDSSFVFMMVIPVDFSEDPHAINSHIKWELSNYFPQYYKDFKVNFYKFKSDTLPGNIKNTLIIGVHSEKYEFIKSILNSAKININFIDIDHFSAEKALRNLYPDDFALKPVIIVGAKKSRLDFSVIDKNDLYYFDYVCFDEFNITKRFSVSFEKLLSQSYPSSPVKMFIYGDSGQDKILQIMESEYPDINVEFANPLNFFNHSAISSDNFNFKFESCKFTPAAGAIFGK